jgi:hypothetical protein
MVKEYTMISKVGRFFDRISRSGNSRDAKMVMESSCVWYNIYEYLPEERQLDVSLSNPFDYGYSISQDHILVWSNI